MVGLSLQHPLRRAVAHGCSLLDSFGVHVARWEVVAVAVPLMLLAAVATHITARFSVRWQQAGQLAPEAGSQAAQVASFMRTVAQQRLAHRAMTTDSAQKPS